MQTLTNETYYSLDQDGLNDWITDLSDQNKQRDDFTAKFCKPDQSKSDTFIPWTTDDFCQFLDITNTDGNNALILAFIKNHDNAGDCMRYQIFYDQNTTVITQLPEKQLNYGDLVLDILQVKKILEHTNKDKWNLFTIGYTATWLFNMAYTVNSDPSYLKTILFTKTPISNNKINIKSTQGGDYQISLSELKFIDMICVYEPDNLLNYLTNILSIYKIEYSEYLNLIRMIDISILIKYVKYHTQEGDDIQGMQSAASLIEFYNTLKLQDQVQSILAAQASAASTPTPTPAPSPKIIVPETPKLPYVFSVLGFVSGVGALITLLFK